MEVRKREIIKGEDMERNRAEGRILITILKR